MVADRAAHSRRRYGRIVPDRLEELLTEQMRYYQARAPEYDESYTRQGRHDHGAEANARWIAELAEARRVLQRLPLDGARILELAAGSGIWTETLAARASAVTAVDASAEMIARSRTRLGPLADRVRYEQHDLFSWRPAEAYHLVVFCFWITHVPVERLDQFLGRVADTLVPGGSVFFIDNRRGRISLDVAVLGHGGNRVTERRLSDGREYRIIKNYWDADELARRCLNAALDVHVTESTFFQYGVGQRLTDDR